MFSIAQTAAGNLINTMLCAVEAGSTVGKKGMVLMPSYAIFQSRSTPEIPSQADIKRGVGWVRAPLSPLSKVVQDESALPCEGMGPCKSVVS